ncbi:MAG TPA: Gfo/Idh/MocA family oxidoreductase [Candidatus Hydrogenedentes bacterium]|nr:Gfo/Idh/MocA family oxidoreductase [Candidatus Hydrogenedentota bacterium]
MKTKWGVWGSGGIARRRTIPEGIVAAGNAELTAVYDVNAEVNNQVAEEFDVVACDTEDALLESDCEIIYVATPANTHCGQVIRAAQAGKHVLCEKPLGMDVEEAERMIAACEDNGVKLGTAFMMRFHAQHQEALKLVREGMIGTPVLARAQLSCWYPPIPGAWRQYPEQSGGGSLMDMGGHCIDLLEMFYGRAQRVQCLIGNLVHDYPSEDTAVVILEFENGAKGMVDNLFNVPDSSSKNRLELYGSRGSILAEGTIGQGEIGEMTAYLESGDTGYEAKQARTGGSGIAITPDPLNMYRAEVEAFARAVVSDREPPVSAEDGLWSQRVLAACYEAAKTGCAVSL